MVLAIANDRQFRDFCIFANLDNLYKNPKFKTNSSRVKNRDELNKILKKTMKTKRIEEWVHGLLKVNVPCGPINDIKKKVFEDQQVVFRKMKISMNHLKSKTKLDLIANPIKFSESKIRYRKSPPILGQDTHKILKNFVKLKNKEIII